MRHHPVTAFALVAAALMAASGAASVATAEILREQSDLSFEISGWKVLELDNARGSVAVRRSPDNRVHLVALKIVRGGDRKHAEQIAGQIDVTTEQSGDRFIVTAHYPPRTDIQIGFWDMLSGNEFPRAELRLEVEAPEALPVRLLSTSGDLSTEDRVGPQTFETHSGDIKVRRARGPLEATTTSGDVQLGLRAPLRSVEIQTSNGDVKIDLARGLGCALDLRTTSGTLDVGVPMVLRGADRHAMAGSIAGGGTPLTVRTSSGDVTVTSGAGR